MSKETKGKKDSKSKKKTEKKKETSGDNLAIMQQAGLKEYGDELVARYTKKGNPMIKIKTDGGSTKYSEIHYKNKIVKTLSTPIKP